MDKKIPTLLGLVLVGIMVTAIVVLMETLSRNQISANPTLLPTRVTITNITDSSFTVTWITTEKTTGIITVTGAKKKKESFFDDRDQGNTLTSSGQHSVTAVNRDPQTEYAIELVINGAPYKNRENPLRVTTAPDIGAGGNSLAPASGTVLYAENQPANDTLVYVSLEGGQLLSTLVTSSGRWVVPLTNTRTTDLSQYIGALERITLLVRAVSGTDETTAITDTLNDSPVPTMIMGRTYDFRKIQAKKPSSLAGTSVESPAVLGTQTTDVILATPANGAALISSLPLISGTGVPGKTVAIVLGMTDPVAGQTTVGSDGTWRFTPINPLGEGTQSITMTTTNKDGKPVAITHTFTVFKSGTQVLGVATPSATLTPSPAATSSPTLAPTPVPTAQPIPESGTVFPTYLLLLAGAGLIGSGLLFIKRYPLVSHP